VAAAQHRVVRVLAHGIAGAQPCAVRGNDLPCAGVLVVQHTCTHEQAGFYVKKGEKRGGGSAKDAEQQQKEQRANQHKRCVHHSRTAKVKVV
jgi:hypothetical protein